jgi:hypothetical protein
MVQRAKLPKLALRAEPQESVGTTEQGKGSERRDREGKKIIAGHFPKSTWAELRRLAVDEDKTAQELLEEALADLFAKYRR